MIVRTSDHGELGLSHGGLRQKMFNAYEESIRVPLIVSNPVLFPEARESDALVSLVDLVPTFLGLAGAAPEPGRFDGHDLGPLMRGQRRYPAWTTSRLTTMTRTTLAPVARPARRQKARGKRRAHPLDPN